ncbi:MAG: aminomethyl transferase family protein [Ignavibacteria bacterium]|nr:aminomethyl transferase family protein [Ignavibacteria bacterium]
MLNPTLEIFKNLYPQIKISEKELIQAFYDERSEALSFYDSASIYDASHYSIFKLTGKDVLEFLNRVSTNETLSLQNYAAKTTLLLSEKGRVIDRLKIIRLKDEVILIGSPDNAERVFRWIERYIIMDDVQIENISGKYCYFKIIGSKVESFSALLFNDQIQNAQFDRVYQYFSQDFTSFIIKTSIFKNNTGYEVLTPIESAFALISYMNSNLEMFETKFVGEDAYNIIRIEQGHPTYPNEINDSVNPYEIGLMNAVNSTKGCYIGQEVIARLETYDKVQKNLIGVAFGSEIIPNDLKLFYNSEEVGEITSIVNSYRLKRQIGLALISKKLKLNGNGDKLQIKAVDESFCTVDLQELPYIRI